MVIINTPNSAVNYFNSCQTYDKYRMQVTDHRSQVQVRVKAGQSPYLGKKQNKTKQNLKCLLTLITTWNRV